MRVAFLFPAPVDYTGLMELIAIGIILIAVFLYHAPDWGGLAITTLVCLVGVGDMLVAIVRALLQLAR